MRLATLDDAGDLQQKLFVTGASDELQSYGEPF